MSDVEIKDIDPKRVAHYGIIDADKKQITELVAITKPVAFDRAGELTCYVCGNADHPVVYLGNNWYVCAQCMFNGVRQGYFKLVHQGQPDAAGAAPQEKPVFHEDGTTEVGGITVAWK